CGRAASPSAVTRIAPGLSGHTTRASVTTQPPGILTVSQLTALLRDRVETGFPDVWIEGEVGNLRCPASGHVYFTLKDSQCQLRAVLFRSGAQRLRFALKEGMQVIVRGRLTVYEPRGEYRSEE